MVHETRRMGHTVLRPTHHWEARVPLAKDSVAPGVVPMVVRAEDHAETARPAFAFHLPVVSLDLRAVYRCQGLVGERRKGGKGRGGEGGE